jgi:hypothetical protein
MAQKSSSTYLPRNSDNWRTFRSKSVNVRPRAMPSACERGYLRTSISVATFDSPSTV